MAEKSGIFDSIRIKSRRTAKPIKNVNMCEWEECEKPGTHRAPKSQKANNEFHNFCITHVRKYNQSFNFFAENKEGEKSKSDENFERPTWRFGTNSNYKTVKKKPKPSDPTNLYARLEARTRGDNPNRKSTRRLVDSDRRALEVLGLKGRHEAVEIKIAYKTLVKIHHPDVNGGDVSSEERLRVIITAYNHLKKKGLV